MRQVPALIVWLVLVCKHDAYDNHDKLVPSLKEQLGQSNKSVQESSYVTVPANNYAAVVSQQPAHAQAYENTDQA